MGRMHSKGKGMSGTALPYKRTPPSWLKFTDTEVRPRLQIRASTAASTRALRCCTGRACSALHGEAGPPDRRPERHPCTTCRSCSS